MMHRELPFIKLINKKVLLLLLSIFLVNRVYSSSVKDTLFINTEMDDYPVYKYLHLFKTNKIINPELAYKALDTANLTRLYPNRAYTERLTVSRHYWLVFNIKNNLPYDRTLYYQLNSQPLDVVKGYENTVGKNFRYLGLSGSDVPFNSRAYHYYDIVFPLLIKAGKTATIMLCIDNNDGDNIRFMPQLRDENVFRAEEERFYMVTGAITGIMLIVFVFI